MEEIITGKKLEKIENYYKNKGLLIVGLNDSQGVNTTSTFFKKGLLEYLADSLTTKKLDPVVINAFSLTMNKTEHIDYFLDNNLSLEEIKLSQIYSAVSAFEKVMKDLHLPKFLGQVANIYKFVYKIDDSDCRIKLADSMKYYKEPIIIYSSGVNDLMRAVGSNPFSIKKIYKDRFTRPNYFYTLDKSTNPKTLNIVIDSVEKNFEKIYSINNNSDIYTLGAYIPKSLNSDEMNIFRDLVIRYNDKLSNLCTKYGVTFIDTETIGEKYNNSEFNFHVNSTGHNQLANEILKQIYNKIDSKDTKKYPHIDETPISNKGALGVMEACQLDYENTIYNAENEIGFASKRLFDIAKEHKRETEIFEKVYKRKTR